MYNPAGYQIKLINFGSASILSNRAYNFVRGTDIYIPPEHYLNSQYRDYRPKPGAVWAIGVLGALLSAVFLPSLLSLPSTRLSVLDRTGAYWLTVLLTQLIL